MVSQLVFIHRFRNEMKKEYLYIKERNARAAESVQEHILRCLERLKIFPSSGRSWRLEGTRELIIPSLPYSVIYKIDGERIILLTLFHTARKFPPLLH